MTWQQTKFDAGYGAISWPDEFGGAGLPVRVRAGVRRGGGAGSGRRARMRRSRVTVRLIAPTVRLFGPTEQRATFVRRFLRAEELCCQLFSEPGAGSDLAGLATRAVRDGDEWVVNGQKVWSSGARFAAVGRADRSNRPGRPEACRHDGVHRPDGCARRRGAADPADVGWGVVQRGVLHRRAHPRSTPPRRRRRRVEGRADDARVRARRPHGESASAAAGQQVRDLARLARSAATTRSIRQQLAELYASRRITRAGVAARDRSPPTGARRARRRRSGSCVGRAT